MLSVHVALLENDVYGGGGGGGGVVWLVPFFFTRGKTELQNGMQRILDLQSGTLKNLLLVQYVVGHNYKPDSNFILDLLWEWLIIDLQS